MKPKKCLSLNRETVKRLDRTTLEMAAGGGNTCTCYTCLLVPDCLRPLPPTRLDIGPNVD